LVSGSWPGEIFLFKGAPDHTFASPEMLKDKNGEIINVGGGIRQEPDGSTLITGNAKFENTDGKSFVTYHGKRLESTPDKPISTTGSASTVDVADWDGDGDLDLLIGNFNGGVYLIPNEGTSTSYAFGKERPLMANGQPVKVNGKAAPFAADWDKDGDLDLLVGADDGSVWLYRNVGSRRAPELAAGVQLVPPGDALYGQNATKDVRRGTRSKICVADWNGDGRPDLLVGDLTYQKPDLPEPTPEQKIEQARVRKELDSARARFSELAQRMRGSSRPRTQADTEKLSKDLQEAGKRMEELQAKLPPECETHGWVWLFLRRE
jgi:hypothetical protein